MLIVRKFLQNFFFFFFSQKVCFGVEIDHLLKLCSIFYFIEFVEIVILNSFAEWIAF